MRIAHSLKNIKINIFSQIIIILLGFISRKVFIDNLGSEYLGINGFLGNILSAMIIIEGGIGISIVYNLYKPLAEKNKEEIIALVQLYKKVCIVLAIIMTTISYIAYPFLGRFIKVDSSIAGIGIVYFIFVFKNAISYIYSYKWVLINADQRGYYLVKNNLICQVICIVGKIIILLVTKNYIAYLLIELALFIVQNVVNSKIVNKLYPYIKTKNKYRIDKKIKTNIEQNVRAMFIQNIGSYAIFSTDNIIISALVNINSVGLYSNYTMIIDQLSALVSPIITGIGNSIGNLIATEDNKKTYSIFKVTYFVGFWIYSVSTIFLFNLLVPFIEWWLGNQYLLDDFTFIIILINFYMSGMRIVITIFKSKSGLFVHDKYAPVMEGIINLVVSIVLAKRYGLVGVFLGTTLSYLVISFWNQPRIVYKYIFKEKTYKYFIKYVTYSLLTIITGCITTIITNKFIVANSFINLVYKGILCLIIPNLIYILIFYKTDEFKYLINIFKPTFIKIKEKIAVYTG